MQRGQPVVNPSFMGMRGPVLDEGAVWAPLRQPAVPWFCLTFSVVKHNELRRGCEAKVQPNDRKRPPGIQHPSEDRTRLLALKGPWALLAQERAAALSCWARTGS